MIDFPQVVSPDSNRNAWQIFHRDILRLCEYFIRQGVRVDPDRLAVDLWRSNGYHIRPDAHPALQDANDPSDRQYWVQNREAE
jgi:serine/threonine-protein kinase RIO1